LWQQKVTLRLLETVAWRSHRDRFVPGCLRLDNQSIVRQQHYGGANSHAIGPGFRLMKQMPKQIVLFGFRKRPATGNPVFGKRWDIALMQATLFRTLLLSAAIACFLVPARCLGEDANQLPEKATKELSPELLSLLHKWKMPEHSPIILRIFKEEAELEVWKQDTTGRFHILKIYPICRWSGDLGPKLHEGDRQTPEGFYSITPKLMNPNSNFYLAINIGFPNAFDKANDRDGSFLMIHGDCASSGCYAMTDEQISEIYSLARDTFLGGQPSFQVQAYPFRMTPANLARHRTNPNMTFWKMLKIGNDHFEATHLQPKVDVCNRGYVFDAEQSPNSSQALVFDPKGQCPAFVVNPKFARVALQKQRADDLEYAHLVKGNLSVAPIYSGLDGGMNELFHARYPGKIIPLAIVLRPGSGLELPQLPPVPWANNDDSFTSEFFGASIDSKTWGHGTGSTISASIAWPTIMTEPSN
jgi:murein L,D-transpeptidase YafK